MRAGRRPAWREWVAWGQLSWIHAGHKLSRTHWRECNCIVCFAAWHVALESKSWTSIAVIAVNAAAAATAAATTTHRLSRHGFAQGASCFGKHCAAPINSQQKIRPVGTMSCFRKLRLRPLFGGNGCRGPSRSWTRGQGASSWSESCVIQVFGSESIGILGLEMFAWNLRHKNCYKFDRKRSETCGKISNYQSLGRTWPLPASPPKTSAWGGSSSGSFRSSAWRITCRVAGNCKETQPKTQHDSLKAEINWKRERCGQRWSWDWLMTATSDPLVGYSSSVVDSELQWSSARQYNFWLVAPLAQARLTVGSL